MAIKRKKIADTVLAKPPLMEETTPLTEEMMGMPPPTLARIILTLIVTTTPAEMMVLATTSASLAANPGKDSLTFRAHVLALTLDSHRKAECPNKPAVICGNCGQEGMKSILGRQQTLT